MIIKIEMYGCQCDNCYTHWKDEDNGFVGFDDQSGMETYIGDDSDWYTDGDKHYCPGCWTYDKEGEIVLIKHK